MSDYPRDLLITEDVIRDFEERVGVRFINKTECAKALAEHDAKVKAEAVEDCYQKGYMQGRADAFHEVITEMCKSPFTSEKVSIVKRYIQEQLKESK